MNSLSISKHAERNAQIIAALVEMSADEVAKKFGLYRNHINRIANLEKRQECFALTLTDGQSSIPIASVKTHKGFINACKIAVTAYSSTFSRLEIPSWRLVAGENSIFLKDLDDTK